MNRRGFLGVVGLGGATCTVGTFTKLAGAGEKQPKPTLDELPYSDYIAALKTLGRGFPLFIKYASPQTMVAGDNLRTTYTTGIGDGKTFTLCYVYNIKKRVVALGVCIEGAVVLDNISNTWLPRLITKDDATLNIEATRDLYKKYSTGI